MAFYAGVLGLSNDHDRLANVADYILAHKLERITNRDVQRGDRTMRNLTRRETEAIFEQLEAFGWVTRIRAASLRPAALDRQSGRTSEVCGASGGGEEAPRNKSAR